MNSATTTPPEHSAAGDAALADLVERYLARLQAGESIDPGVFAAEHPEHAERLVRLLPALELMDDLRRSSSDAGSYLSLTPVLAEAAGIAPGRLGDFQIIREVGRGGMGVVYEARQISLDRRVALKVLPMAAAMEPRQLQRFQLEARAAACLHHTNIVPVHAVGCERGVHYYAMQFIEGQTLAAIIGELRMLRRLDEGGLTETKDLMPTLASGELAPAEPGPPAVGRPPAGPPLEPSPRPSTPPVAAETAASTALGFTHLASGPAHQDSSRGRAFFRTVARLGIEAAEAIEHAHGLGGVHRDIKPANLLVDPRGTLWITDFGLARLTNDPGLTMTGDVMGTLRYMSPEQAMGRAAAIDHRTDIYSLAVTLYELLTGKPAIDGHDRQEVLRKIAHEAPIPPRRVKPAIPGELETIILKAMSKEPESRYATAQELADDLRRFLEHKPIRARRPSPLERAVKWSRRHRSIVVTASVSIMCSLILAVIGLTLANLQIQAEKRRTDAEKARAEANFRKARAVVDRMFTQAAEELTNIPRTDRVRRALLLDALVGSDPKASVPWRGVSLRPHAR